MVSIHPTYPTCLTHSLGGDADIGGHGQTEARADGRPVHRGDHGDGQAPEGEEAGVEGPHDAVVVVRGGGPAFVEPLEVAARLAECWSVGMQCGGKLEVGSLRGINQTQKH